MVGDPFPLSQSSAESSECAWTSQGTEEEVVAATLAADSVISQPQPRSFARVEREECEMVLERLRHGERLDAMDDDDLHRLHCGKPAQSMEAMAFYLYDEELSLPTRPAPKLSEEARLRVQQAWKREHKKLRKSYVGCRSPLATDERGAESDHWRRSWLARYRVPPAVWDVLLNTLHDLRSRSSRELEAWQQNHRVPTEILLAAVLQWSGGTPHHSLQTVTSQVLSKSTFFRYLHPIVRSLGHALRHKIAFPFSASDAEAAAKENVIGAREGSRRVNSTSYLPNTLGAVDGYHVPVRVPRKTSSDDHPGMSAAALVDRTGTPSINVQCIVSKTTRVLYIGAQTGGSTPDAAAFQRTIISHSMARSDTTQALEEAQSEVRELEEQIRKARTQTQNPNDPGAQHWSAMAKLPEAIEQRDDAQAARDAAHEDDRFIPTWPRGFHLVGDNGYPLRRNLLTPFAQLPASAWQIDADHQDHQKAVLNYNVSRIRQSSERVFGLFERRFPRMRHGFEIALEHVAHHVLFYAVLHNLCLEEQDTADRESDAKFWEEVEESDIRALLLRTREDDVHQRRAEAREELLRVLHRTRQRIQEGAADIEDRAKLEEDDGDAEGKGGDDEDADEEEVFVEVGGARAPLSRGEVTRDKMIEVLFHPDVTQEVNWRRLMPEARGASTAQTPHDEICRRLLQARENGDGLLGA